MDKLDFISACARGGKALDKALGDMSRAYVSPLLRDARQSLSGTRGSSELAFDLVQETFFKAWRRCRDFRGDASVLAWLRAILRHSVIDQLRRLRPEVPLLDSDEQISQEVEQALSAAAAGPLPDPQSIVERAELQRLYEQCYARFAQAHPQAAAVLRWVAEDELSIDEVAAILGRGPAATRQFVSQSRKKARTYLAPWYAMVRPNEKQVA